MQDNLSGVGGISRLSNYRWWLLVAGLLFAAGMAVGFALPVRVGRLVSEDVAGLQRLAGMLAGMPPLVMALFLYAKNVSVLLLSFALSPFLCGVPLLSLVLNGLLLAYAWVVVGGQRSVGFVLAGILPHGVFELPAFVLGEAAALMFGVSVLLAVFKRDRRQQLPSVVKRSFRWLVIACIILLPAAIIETWVTPLLLRLVG